jgi:hypothetical protein
MKNRDRPYIETALESLGGGLGAIAGSGILIASAATPAISLVAGAAGAVGGVMLAKSDGVAEAIRDLETYRTICRCLKDKFDADVQHCDLLRHDQHRQAHVDALSVLKSARVISKSLSDNRIPSDEIWDFPSTLVDPENLRHQASLLVANGPIKVNCSVISVAAACTLYSISRRYRRFGLELEIHNDFQNGKAQMAAITTRGPYDFIIAPNDPFFLAAESVTSEYRILGPTNGEIQHAFRRKSRHQPRAVSVLTYALSSAELHFRAGIGVPSNAEPEFIEDAMEIPERLEDIGGGDCVFAWEPLANLLNNNHDFEVVPGSRHTIQFSLFCLKSWRHPKKRLHRNAFKQIFRNEWLHCVANRQEHLDRLQRDNDFIRHFALGCGRALPSSTVVRALRWLRYTLPSVLHLNSKETEQSHALEPAAGPVSGGESSPPAQ